MLTYLKNWFAPPVFEDEEITRRASLLNTSINALSVGSLIVLAGLFLGSFPPFIYGAIILEMVLFEFLRWWMKRGWVYLAASFLTISFSSAVALAISSLGTIRTPGTAILVLSILAAEIILGGRATFGVILLNSVYVGVLIIGERRGWLPDPSITVGFTQWIGLVATFGVAGAFLHSATRTIDHSLAKARHELAERQRTEVHLEARERYFRALVENIAEVVTLLDQHGTTLYVSPTIQNTLGYLPEERIGHSGFALVHPDDLEYVRGRFQEIVATPSLYFTSEFRLRHKNGEWRWVSVTGKNLLNDPAIQAVVVNYRDITENKLTEKALKESETRFRSILSAVPDLIFISGSDGTYYDFFTLQPERLGLPREQVIGRTIHDIFPPEIAEPFQEKLNEAAATSEVIEYEYSLPSRAGGHHWFQARAVAYHSPEGQRIVWLARDISAQKQAEAEILKLNSELERRVEERTSQLQLANRELEAFSYSVSHDLRAPLRAIDGFASLLSELHGYQLDEQGQRYLHLIQQAAQRMGLLIDDLLKLSRISRKEMRWVACSLSDLAQEIFQDLHNLHPERQVEIHIHPNMTVQGDPNLMRVMLENLLGNAWKFTSKRLAAQITFGVAPHENEPIFFVRDNGAGFDMAYADKLFGAFQRLHQYEDFEGTGIGLATVQRIIHRHGGRIWAEAEVEQGACFYFTLG
ncbi:MAG: hypothetical protein Fur0022_47520 [Anaerolineales bacterium]